MKILKIDIILSVIGIFILITINGCAPQCEEIDHESAFNVSYFDSVTGNNLVTEDTYGTFNIIDAEDSSSRVYFLGQDYSDYDLLYFQVIYPEERQYNVDLSKLFYLTFQEDTDTLRVEYKLSEFNCSFKYDYRHFYLNENLVDNDSTLNINIMR